MDSILSFLISHGAMAPLSVFGLFMMAGLSIPISEDLLILTSGILAGRLGGAFQWQFYCAVILGAFFSDWIPYWVGRKLGRKILAIKWVAKRIKQERIDSIQNYYNRFGIWTILIGRFIPFGVRNCLFLTAGISRMRFSKFVIADSLAVSIGVSLLFALAFLFGKSCLTIFSHVLWIEISALAAFLFLLIGFFCYKKWKSKNRVSKPEMLDN